MDELQNVGHAMVVANKAGNGINTTNSSNNAGVTEQVILKTATVKTIYIY